MESVMSVLSQDWLLGAVVGASLAYLAEWRSNRARRGEEQKVAAMLVASDLRLWTERTTSMIFNLKNWLTSDGQGGRRATEILDFPFEKSLDQVARLKSADAVAVFDLIHAKNAVNDEIDGLVEYGSEDDIYDVLLGRSSKLYLDAIEIYRRLADQVGWKGTPFSDKVTDAMRTEVKRVEEIERNARKENALIPKGGSPSLKNTPDHES